MSLAGVPDTRDIPPERPREIRRKRWELAQALLEPKIDKLGGREKFFDAAFRYISAGGFINDLCADEFLDRGALLAEIRANPELNRRYEAAVVDRKSARSEGAQAFWAKVMDSVPEESAATFGEALKASELMARNTGALRDGPGSLQVNVGGSLIAILSGMESGEPQEAPALPEPIDGTATVVTEAPELAERAGPA